ncbi:tRNA A-37 threonylcarbamoyl transferase component Bud32 [Streptosporangium becharense]|uniref:non-specific serine/threonine protein kinase n=1 Tax=Streptosporangium becharense TaxID=1816182 RepID=A0A7W9INE2_9ACTN|nr:class IV lanthionine synthetase LanL [Streptosporangium becharense]MBB2910585.1 tRNA A-37 threonylcarbamoyl transferase component Bud32 [Streptosporangium becharense]MBB5823328.1 tRNA A-37 threonylcarbamoyl transferase component Bud32 [Streptosporangium becharense]
MSTYSEDPDLLRDIVAAELDRAETREWSITEDGFWCKVAPKTHELPDQGWKLHVSATMLSAPVVLSRVARVLAEAGCAFKFPARLRDYWDLLQPHCSRAQAGKFVTVYPRDDAESVRLAALLDEATRGLPGPVILSDRPYRPGGIVHYRYGAFSGHRVLGNDGFYEIRLRSPEGRFVLDERQPRFSPPSFAVCPFEAPQAQRRSGASSVMLNDRFVVREAVRHANRGGVYLAEDTKTGRQVVVKEGRPHACADLGGRDARDRIATERSSLERLAGSGAVPALVDFFEQGGHVFLVEEFIPGITLQRWSDGNAGPLGESGFGNDAAAVLPIAGRLVELVKAVHEREYVFRDLSPNNVMLLPDGGLRLIDLEHATVPGTVVMVGGTKGYLAPELAEHGGEFRPAPEPAADLYSLGAMMYFLAVGAHPDPPVLPRIAAASTAGPTLALLRPLVEGLMATEPQRRWSLADCERFLAGLTPEQSFSEGAGPAPERIDRLIDDGIAHLVEAVDARDDGLSPWTDPADAGAETDPCSVNGGAAGFLAVLTQALPEAETADAVTALSGWLRRRLEEEDVWRPGLYFGRSGAVWALCDAATALGDAELARFAARAAALLPADHPSPDVTHGLAGCGMAVLRVALRTREAALRDHATEIFRNLHDARSYLDGHPQWPIPQDFDSGLAGANHFGFAHGIAGIGTALLQASRILDRPDWAATVDEIARTFYAYADLDGDTAWWPTLRADLETSRPRRPHWCSGSSGVGSFLVRYWSATGDEQALDLARAAATAVHRTRWQSGTVPCHGLPGDGEFLLDMADFTGEDRYHRQAADLAGCLETWAVERSGRLLVPGRDGRPALTFLGGTAGTAAFLLRLRHRHPRLWMLDDAHRLTAPARER